MWKEGERGTQRSMSAHILHSLPPPDLTPFSSLLFLLNMYTLGQNLHLQAVLCPSGAGLGSQPSTLSPLSPKGRVLTREPQKGLILDLVAIKKHCVILPVLKQAVKIFG